MRVLGIMSGTSMDGVDYVVCNVEAPAKIKFEEHWQAKFPRPLGNRIRAAAANKLSSHDVGQLHHDLGRFYARFAAEAKIDLVGLHGQTIFHHPHRSTPATLQIGEPAYLAETLKVPVVSNFRAADIAAGGEGAPLATLFHREVFARKDRHVAINNLGGISNVTSLDWRLSTQPRVLAFDTGPGNVLIDLAVQEYTAGKRAFDRDGLLAAGGEINHSLVVNWLRHPFFTRKPPKSTGREMFGAEFYKRCAVEARKIGVRGVDLIATLTELTARGIALNYKCHLPAIPDEVILCGGGSQNPFLFARIAEALREHRFNLSIVSSDTHGWNSQVIEGAAFALLAWKCWRGEPGNVTSTTGASGPRALGQIICSESRLPK